MQTPPEPPKQRMPIGGVLPANGASAIQFDPPLAPNEFPSLVKSGVVQIQSVANGIVTLINTSPQPAPYLLVIAGPVAQQAVGLWVQARQFLKTLTRK